MAKASRKNRTRRLHRLALAAIGLITLNCASPALGNQTISSGNTVNVNNDASTGLYINDPGSTATWGAGSPTDIGEVIFDDNGAAGGDTQLKLTGSGLHVINGDIVNENTATDALIDIGDTVNVLMVENGDIVGNNDTSLVIKNDKSTFVANDSDVRGTVEFVDHSGSGSNSSSEFRVKSIGEEGAATVKTSGADQIKLTVASNFGAAGGSTLNLGGATGTTATINGSIGGTASVINALAELANA